MQFNFVLKNLKIEDPNSKWTIEMYVHMYSFVSLLITLYFVEFLIAIIFGVYRSFLVAWAPLCLIINLSEKVS